ncbi:MAG: HEAT repeat domain-containing protein [Clostridia bacterium]|nr:HEAT repeat domain-containing protein [Clostridia bacterium]
MIETYIYQLMSWFYHPYLFLCLLVMAFIGVVFLVRGIFRLLLGPNRSLQAAAVPQTTPDAEELARLAQVRIKAALQQDELDPALKTELKAGAPLSLNYLAENEINEKILPSLKHLVIREGYLSVYLARLGEKGFSADNALCLWQLFGEDGQLPRLVELLALPSEDGQMEAVRFLKLLKNEALLPYLISALWQPNRFVTARVAEVLLSMGGKTGVVLSALLPSLHSRDDILLVLDILAQTEDRFASDNVVALLSNTDATIRIAAAEVLAQLADIASGQALLIALDDSNDVVRQVCCRALGEICYLPAADQLAELAKSDIPAVQKQAEFALKRIGR